MGDKGEREKDEGGKKGGGGRRSSKKKRTNIVRKRRRRCLEDHDLSSCDVLQMLELFRSCLS